MQAKVKKWGNSLGIRIPLVLAQSLGITENTDVDISSDNEVITIKPSQPKPSLHQLVKEITDKNRHGETDWGKPTGREIW